MDSKHVCSICGKEFDGFGNNAEPVNDGLCCDKCNNDIVIPRRLADIGKKKLSDVNKKVKSFLDDFYKVKFDMLLKAKLQEVVDLGNTSKELVDDLFNETSCKLREIAKSKLDDDVIQCILSDYASVVGDDIDMVFALYEVVYGRKVKLTSSDSSVIFK